MSMKQMYSWQVIATSCFLYLHSSADASTLNEPLSADLHLGSFSMVLVDERPKKHSKTSSSLSPGARSSPLKESESLEFEVLHHGCLFFVVSIFSEFSVLSAVTAEWEWNVQSSA